MPSNSSFSLRDRFSEREDSKNSETFDNSFQSEPVSSLEQLSYTTQEKLNSHPNVVPFEAPIQEPQSATMSMMELSMKNLPEPLDADRPKQYVPRYPTFTPSYFPQVPAIFENPNLFEKFETDTLFFIFYYQQGTYQQ